MKLFYCMSILHILMEGIGGIVACISPAVFEAMPVHAGIARDYPHSMRSIGDGELYAVFKHCLLVEKLLDAGYKVLGLYTGDCKAPLDEQARWRAEARHERQRLVSPLGQQPALPQRQCHIVHASVALLKGRIGERVG